METKLLVHNYGDELKRLALTAIEIKVLIAFLTEGGLDWLPEDKRPQAEFIVGIDLGITTPGALKTLQQQGACVRVFSEPKKMFHPKAIYLRSETDEFLIVGSNNLTTNGISSNHEISLLVHRDESSQGTFRDFLDHFNWVRAHACCGIPDDRFFATYKPTNIRPDLTTQLNDQERMPLLPSIISHSTGNDERIKALGDFIRLLARKFPKLERRRGQKINGHPLRTLNAQEFLPLFKEIVSKASDGRLSGISDLNIGGNWRQIPNILAVDKAREPWENADNQGRVLLQIHFSTDFTKVFQSLVLQYNLKRADGVGQMPAQAAQRFRKLLEHVENASARAKLDQPVFRHWTWKDIDLWSKPLLTFEYAVDALPNDDSLLADMEFLATALNEATLIS